jgi:hypothetical protein
MNYITSKKLYYTPNQFYLLLDQMDIAQVHDTDKKAGIGIFFKRRKYIRQMNGKAIALH